MTNQMSTKMTMPRIIHWLKLQLKNFWAANRWFKPKYGKNFNFVPPINSTLYLIDEAIKNLITNELLFMTMSDYMQNNDFDSYLKE